MKIDDREQTMLIRDWIETQDIPYREEEEGEWM